MRITNFLYGNIRVMPPGREILMFRTTPERAQWYVGKGLGVFETRDLLRLTFEPNGPGHAEDPYFLQEFKNLCVVCGTSEDLSHHHIVPECYRKHFPRDSQRNGTWMYDVLLLCRPCHKKYEARAWERKVEIAKKHGVAVNSPVEADREKVKALKAAAALYRHADAMPSEKRQALEATLVKVVGRVPEASECGVLWKKWAQEIEYVQMGKLIASKIEDYDEFAIEWRVHFIEAMKPGFLPEGWVVDRRMYA